MKTWSTAGHFSRVHERLGGDFDQAHIVPAQASHRSGLVVNLRWYSKTYHGSGNDQRLML